MGGGGNFVELHGNEGGGEGVGGVRVYTFIIPGTELCCAQWRQSQPCTACRWQAETARSSVPGRGITIVSRPTLNSIRSDYQGKEATAV